MEGRCQCGTVRFRTTQAEPVKWYVCHCVECRLQSASAFGISAIFPAFDLLAQNPGTAGEAKTETASDEGDGGNELIGVYTHSRTSSGRHKRCYFCRRCGTRLLNQSVVPGKEGGGGYFAVKGGCLEGIDGDVWTGATHIWTSRALVAIPEGVEKYEEEPPPRMP